MATIKWCLHVKKGIEVVEPNQNLADAYFIKAEHCLEELQTVRTNEWKIATAYYGMYFALYSILMRLGIKCEIHSCTLLFMETFLLEYFTKEDNKLLNDAFRARNDAQYYVDRVVSEETRMRLEKTAPSFVVKCKQIVVSLDEKNISLLRKKVEEMKKEIV